MQKKPPAAAIVAALGGPVNAGLLGHGVHDPHEQGRRPFRPDHEQEGPVQDQLRLIRGHGGPRHIDLGIAGGFHALFIHGQGAFLPDGGYEQRIAA